MKNQIIKFFSKNGQPLYKASIGEAGYKLYSTENIIIQPEERIKIPSGIFCEMPEGYEGKIHNLAEVFLTKGLFVVTGTIDNDYRGEIFIIATNFNKDTLISIEAGEKVAEMICTPYESVESDTNLLKIFSTSGKTLYKATIGSAGYDLYSSQDIIILPNQCMNIPTGLFCQFPEGYSAEILSRSGMSFKKGLYIMSETIDSHHTGEIIITGMNLNHDESLHIETGTRVGQIVIAQYANLELVHLEHDELLL